MKKRIRQPELKLHTKAAMSDDFTLDELTLPQTDLDDLGKWMDETSSEMDKWLAQTPLGIDELLGCNDDVYERTTFNKGYKVKLGRDCIRFWFPYSETFLNSFKTSLSSRRFDWGRKCWYTPIAPKYATELVEFLIIENVYDKADIDERVLFLTDIDYEAANEDEYEIPTTLKGELYPFQADGARYLARKKRAFLADDQGLGKTIQALAAIEMLDAYPCVVVCPSIVKEVWRDEVGKYLPHRSVAVLSGRSGFAPPADIVVVNYEVVAWRVESLKTMVFKSVIVDESHYIKSGSTARAKACVSLADGIGVRFALSGTPLLNHPREFASQIRFLGRSTEFKPLLKYIVSQHKVNSGEQRIFEDLGSILKKRCLIRRRKEDVLKDLPPKREQEVVFNCSLPSYGQAEQAYYEERALRGYEQDKAGGRLFTLLKALGEAKVDITIEWIEVFLESNDSKLIVFAHHKDVQLAIAKHFDSLALAGSMSEDYKRRAVSSFQSDPAKRLIVCSLKAASTGITLTAASNVLFVERGWNDATHQQAIDRCHRIGQRKPVTAYYLTVANTLDEFMAARIADKQRSIDGTIRATETDTKSALDDVVRRIEAE
jgi:SWI/SNF-related matrix-associated actin-dependent regulator of chromatin subfamily A-like protein 1